MQTCFNLGLNLLIVYFLIHSIEISIGIGTFIDGCSNFLLRLGILLLNSTPILRFRSGASSNRVRINSDRWIILILLLFFENGFKRLHILCLCVIVQRPHVIEVTKVLDLIARTPRPLWLFIIPLTTWPFDPCICLLLVEVKTVNSESLRCAL